MRAVYAWMAALLCGAPLSAAVEIDSSAASSYIRVAEQDEDGATLIVRIPPSAVSIESDGDGFHTIGIRGLTAEQRPGLPALPVLVAAVGVPDGAEIRLSTTPGPARILEGMKVRTVPEWSSEPVTPAEFGVVAERSAPTRWPPQRVTVEDVRFRDLRIARLEIYPAAHDSEAEQILLHLEWTVRLDFVGGEGFSPVPGGILDRLADGVVSERLANRATVLEGRRLAAIRHTPSRAQAASSSSNPAVKIRVNAEGLVRVTQPALAAIGFDPAGVDPRNLELSYRGVPVPCRITGEGDGTFDPADAIELWGTPGEGRFSGENVYWLEEKTVGPGLRFATADATPGAPLASRFQHTQKVEEGNSIYTAGKPAQEGEPRFFWKWFEDNPAPPRIKTFSHTLNLPGLDATGTTAYFRASFLGRTDVAANPDHRVRFFVNGTSIGDSMWNGQTFHEAQMPFNVSLLVAGNNTFRIDYVSITFPDIYYLDWYAIEYPRLTQAVGERMTIAADASNAADYSVSGFTTATDPVVLSVGNPLAPVELTGASVTGSGPYTIRFQAQPGDRVAVVADGGRIAPAGLLLDAPSDLKSTANGADLIIVVPAGWESGVAALVTHRQAQGLRVKVATLTDVADEFAGGNVDDVAIRDFVGHAYHEWQAPRVSYVLLVGEPNRDARNFLNVSPFYSFMPTHLGVTDSFGETETDTWFGAVAGVDLLPDVAVGRLSVRSAGAAAQLAARIIDYENNPPSGAAWGENVLQIASSNSAFEDSLEAAAAFLPPHFTVDSEYRNSGASTSSIRNAFNSGALMASFLGHGNVTFWADSPGGSFFNTTNVGQLANAGRLPFVTALNCINGLIGHPTVVDCMAESFHDPSTSDGALAIWSPAALGFLGSFDVLQTNLYETIFEEHETHLGSATLLSLVETFLAQPFNIDLVKEMILLGDPAGWLALDADDDQVLDHLEIASGLDPQDRDSDDDGLLDGLEGGAAVDSDADGTVNALDFDSDNDALLDGVEAGLVSPDADTDVAQGFFQADADPLTTTDPLDPDTDDGGVPDGVEDLNADGAATSPETDPQNAADDVACNAGAVPEIAVDPADQLQVGRSGADLVLAWGDERADFPCILYRVYVADDYDHGAGAAAFRLLTVTGQTTYTHRDGAAGDLRRRYLVVGATLADGEGVWGHFGQ